ncbi:MAG: glycosyltransferase family 4 protein [Candidatus Dormibacteraeota bacterium]|nr:glycosyltransferase family 4 protein [Candidatus Dormibacteraeota bacterium]
MASRRPLRVALDTRALADDATGVGRYIGALIRAFRGSHGIDLIPYPDRGLPLLGPQLELPLRVRRDGAQLIHGPANALPLLHLGLPGVVTIHDLAIYDHPEWFPSGQWFALRVIVPQSVRGARLIICPSEATKNATVRLFGIEPERCRVIPHGVETEFALPASTSVKAEVKARYALPDRYLLQLGTVQPRKNYVTSLRALARIPAEQRMPLIVAGAFGWKYDAVVDAVRELGLRQWVRFVGYAGMPDLPALYQMAQAVLFPSLDEGFGLPVLEAFAAGTPVVASNAGAIPEVAGDAALLSAPEDAQALADNLLGLLTDRQLRERQVAAGRARAALYSWSVSAAAHRNVYQSIVAR